MTSPYLMVEKYPRLARAMQHVAILSAGETEACLRDLYLYGVGPHYVCEAVAHFGGAEAVLRAARRLHSRTHENEGACL